MDTAQVLPQLPWLSDGTIWIISSCRDWLGHRISNNLLTDRSSVNRKDVKKRQLIEAEFPAVVEMLTLAIAAGETPMSAMLRIANSADGTESFKLLLQGRRSGAPLHELWMRWDVV